MIKNPSYSAKVKINDEKSPGMKSCKNPYAVDDVNQASGPRIGNSASRDTKRSEFQSGKKERSNLADSINKAYGMRTVPPTVDPRLESVESDVKPRKFKR